MKNAPLLFGLVLFGLFGCSKSENGPSVSRVAVSTNTDIAIINQDTVFIKAEAFNADNQLIENAQPTVMVNGQVITTNFIVPSARGTLSIDASYENIQSNTAEVRAIDLAQDLEELVLYYDGYRLLTNNPWSVSGNFSFAVIVEGQEYSIADNAISLFQNGEKVDKNGAFQFAESGVYEFDAVLNGVKSNKIALNVREEKSYPLITIPVVFHVLGQDFSFQDMERLVDTLNNSFNRTNYSLNEVLSGKTNPNAVDMGIRFEPAQVAPDGFSLNNDGIHIISGPSDDFELPTLNQFANLAKEHTWPTDTYINYWISPGIGYEKIEPYFSLNAQSGRGTTNYPLLEAGQQLAGLTPIDGLNPRDMIEPDQLIHGVILNSLTLLEHHDFTVATTGHYLGLYSTLDLGCVNEGDYCPDTLTADFSKDRGSDGSYATCSDIFYFPNNHMSFNARYTNLTYDQRERVRFVLKHGLDRPRFE